jgi:hypothetical protein
MDRIASQELAAGLDVSAGEMAGDAVHAGFWRLMRVTPC